LRTKGDKSNRRGSWPLRPHRKWAYRRAADKRDELAPPDVEHWVSSEADLIVLNRGGALSAPPVLAGRIPHQGAAVGLLHCGISAPSADGFMAEMGHEPPK
jgi:hypothetical protein